MGLSEMETDKSTAPGVADALFHQLDPRHPSLHRVAWAIASVIIAVAAFWAVVLTWLVRLLNGDASAWLGAIGLSAWAGLVIVLVWWTYRWPEISHRHASYRVDEDGVEIRRGVFWRTVINVPRSRVQHLDVSQSPLERRYGLGTLVMYTAGTHHARVGLSGLDHTRALLIRGHLLPTGRGTSDAV